jgi:hypothetical protein
MSESGIERRKELPKPVGLALIVCDAIYKEDGGKRALVGLIDQLRFPEFPFVCPQLTVFGCMTEIMQGTESRVDIVHGESEAVVAVSTTLPPGGSLTAVWEFATTFRNVRFPEPGTYFVRLIANGGIVLQRRLNVSLVNPKKQ